MKIKNGQKLYKELHVEIKGIDKDLGTLDAIFSTQDVDRHGDTVLQDGWDLKNFKKNPVILNNHNYSDATEVIGKASNVRVENKKLQGTIKFAVNENPKAKIIFDLYAGGFLNAFSVGFIVKKFKENKDGTRDWYTIEESELLEVSAVSVPANARALAKQKGIDVDVLDAKEDTEGMEVEGDTTQEPVTTDSQTEIKEPVVSVIQSDEIKEDVIEENTDDIGDSNEKITQKTLTYKQKVAKTIALINEREEKHLRVALHVIQQLLSDESHPSLSKNVQDQIKKRKINKAIRSLLKIK